MIHLFIATLTPRVSCCVSILGTKVVIAVMFLQRTLSVSVTIFTFSLNEA